MREDLVERRHWVAPHQFQSGLALAQLAPGPMATQVAIYIGWVKCGWIGATLAGIALILPSFLMVLLIAQLYTHYAALPWLLSLSHGVGAVVIAIIFKHTIKLSLKTFAKDYLLWIVGLASMLLTWTTSSELLWVFISAGFLVAWWRHPPQFLRKNRHSSASFLSLYFPLFIYFFKAGAMVFGSGLVIIPFLHGGVVDQFHWLNERQFLDAVAVAMITPGPAVITVAFIGFLVAGPIGGFLAALGIFLPCYLFVLLLAPIHQRIEHLPRVRSFVKGITAAAIGAIAGGGILLSIKALDDWPTITIAALGLIALLFSKRNLDLLLIFVGGMIGLLIY
jgi:chromate transporter